MVYAKTIIRGNTKSLNALFMPIIVLWMRIVAFLKGNMFIKVMIPSFKPSRGNHIPESTDWPAITIEEMPPIDFSLHIVPRSMPIAIKNKAVIKLKRIAIIILKLNNDGSNIPPTKKNNIDWIKTMGIIDKAYEKINSYDFAFDTYNLVKKDVDLSSVINKPTNKDKKLSENTTIPGAKYFISNWLVKLWNIK